MNKLHNILKLMGLATVLFMLPGCINTDNIGESYNAVSVENVYPDDRAQLAQSVAGKITFTEINTGRKSTFALPQYDSYKVVTGLYDVEASLTIYFTDDDNSLQSRTLRATASSIAINSDDCVSLKWFYFNPESSLVFSEIYWTGSPNATSTGGIRDTYFKVYNNTDEVIYADGLGIVESCLVNSSTNAFEILTERNNRHVNFSACAIWVIPGSGSDVPVAPGESLTIVDQAIDWGGLVSGGLDHTGADFEWWDDNKQDTDNPSVPNLDKWYHYSITIWIPSNQCNRSYALVRFPEGMTAEKFLAEYHSPYDYVSAIGSIMTNEKCYVIPNSWIIDGVNLSNREKWVYGALDESIDMSYSSISDKDKDPERFGKVMRRKVASVADDGRVILLDTDDSLNDFETVPVK